MAVPRRRLPPLLLLALAPVACVAPDDPATVLQEVMVSHRASLAGLASPAGGNGGVVERAAAAAPTTIPTAIPATLAPLPGMLSVAGQLLGQRPETLLHWLGPPRLRRAEGSAEIWHYQASACHLDLVLYPDEAWAGAGLPPPAPLRVAHASARATGTANRSETACLRDLARPAALPRQEGTRPTPAPGIGAA